MSLNYGTPVCPNTRRRTRMPGDEPCPRSDTYRMFENGTVQFRMGWMFRCRTCDTRWFEASPEAKRAGQKEAERNRLEALAKGTWNGAVGR